MADGETSGLVGEVPLSSSLQVAEGVTAEEMEREEPEESGHSDEDEDEDEINHSALPKETVRAKTPKDRAQKSDIWKHVKRIASHDSLHRGMNVECTHVCVYPLEDGGDGEKRFCNTPLKLFRSSKGKDARRARMRWSTTIVVSHFKKKHEVSSSALKQQAGAAKRQTRLSECMHAGGSEHVQSISSKKSPYGLSESEKVLSAIARWGTYAEMKVSQPAFGDPLFVAMLQAARGPHETKGVVPKLTRSDFKGFMLAEFEVTSPLASHATCS
jgi:hypothetical protein